MDPHAPHQKARQVPRPLHRTRSDEPPPFLIRALLVLTCTGVSFGHGSNDGQKGMGLIMLILIGTVPTAYALNHAIGPDQVINFVAVSDQVTGILTSHADQNAVIGDPRADVTEYVKTKTSPPTPRSPPLPRRRNQPRSRPLQGTQGRPRRRTAKTSATTCTSPAPPLSTMHKKHAPAFNSQEDMVLADYQKKLDLATKFIPLWVKVAVALALAWAP